MRILVQKFFGIDGGYYIWRDDHFLDKNNIPCPYSNASERYVYKSYREAVAIVKKYYKVSIAYKGESWTVFKIK